MSTYWEQLRDPRWQRKRLEVMERAGFKCEECFSGEKTLNVHHTYYAKGRKAWEYELESLRCLCEPCHGETEALLAEAKRLMGSMPPRMLEGLVGFLRAQAFTLEWLGAITLENEVDGYAWGIAAAFGVTIDDVLEIWDKGSRCIDGLALFQARTRRIAQRQVYDAIEHIDRLNPEKGPEEASGG